MAKLMYTLVCDDIRHEKGRKVSLMGLYSNTILVAQFPYIFPRLAFFQHWVDLDDGQTFKIEIRGEHITGIKLEGRVDKHNPQSKAKKLNTNIVLNFNNIKVRKEGKIKFITSISNDTKKYEHEISIALASPEDLK